MGIRNLIPQLTPFATTVLCDGSGQQSDRAPCSKVIIDGPALAHFLYFQRLAPFHQRSDALVLALSHQTIGLAIIAWLESLQDCGLKMCLTIYCPLLGPGRS